ncbi:MAG TPA: hypothetical protein VFI62_07455, partial [Burkholderiales bacterium]|nr:hypothetical protein [Burkholderiales bacterium]
MKRKHLVASVLSAATFAAFSSAAFAQTGSSSNQAVSPSASTTVNAPSEFKAMPHSNVTVSP